MKLNQLKHKYEMIPELILEECWKEAQLRLLEDIFEWNNRDDDRTFKDFYLEVYKKWQEMKKQTSSIN